MVNVTACTIELKMHAGGCSAPKNRDRGEGGARGLPPPPLFYSNMI